MGFTVNKKEATPMSGIPQLRRIPVQNRMETGFNVIGARRETGGVGVVLHSFWQENI